MQKRWKTAKQEEVQDQVESVRLIRSRLIRHETAPEEEEARKDWILERSREEGDEDEWQSRYALKMELDRSLWRFCWWLSESDPESESESEMFCCCEGCGCGGGFHRKLVADPAMLEIVHLPRLRAKAMPFFSFLIHEDIRTRDFLVSIVL